MLSLCSRCFCTPKKYQKPEGQSTEGPPGSASPVDQEGASGSPPLQTLTTDVDTHQRAALGINEADVDEVKLRFQIEDEKKQNLLNFALLQIIQRRICKVIDVIPSTDDSLKLSEDLKGLITFHMDRIMKILDQSCPFELSQNLLEELNDGDNGIIFSQVVDYHPSPDIREFLKSLDSSKGLIHLLNQAECSDQIEKVRSDLAENTSLMYLIQELYNSLCSNDPLTSKRDSLAAEEHYLRTTERDPLATEEPDLRTTERDSLAAEEPISSPSVITLIEDIKRKLEEKRPGKRNSPDSHPDLSSLPEWVGGGQDERHKKNAVEEFDRRLESAGITTGTVDNERSKELKNYIKKFKNSMDGYLSLIDKNVTPANLEQLRAHLTQLEHLHPIICRTNIDSDSKNNDSANKVRDLLMDELKELNPDLFSEQVSLDGVVAVIRSDYEKKSSSVR